MARGMGGLDGRWEEEGVVRVSIGVKLREAGLEGWTGSGVGVVVETALGCKESDEVGVGEGSDFLCPSTWPRLRVGSMTWFVI